MRSRRHNFCVIELLQRSDIALRFLRSICWELKVKEQINWKYHKSGSLDFISSYRFQSFRCITRDLTSVWNLNVVMKRARPVSFCKFHPLMTSYGFRVKICFCAILSVEWILIIPEMDSFSVRRTKIWKKLDDSRSVRSRYSSWRARIVVRLQFFLELENTMLTLHWNQNEKSDVTRENLISLLLEDDVSLMRKTVMIHNLW